ncbi:hypothetical protein [Paenibacillus sp. DMB20]|uniref:hypothetical protein n=1 Tax=Paenibacillus sp. DMB20 TaxID=1642570 RepID=UPI00128D4F32|nr:hypothetical protein [Paenibacillus sp. DMB20]
MKSKKNHSQMFNHRRYSYTAKVRRMFTDIFTFDRCRAFYDWIPLIEFYGANVATLERQMILRSCIGAIGGKQLGFTPIPIYDSGVSVIGMFEEEWAPFINEIPGRKNYNRECCWVNRNRTIIDLAKPL